MNCNDEPCPACEGIGRIPGDDYDCLECFGDGLARPLVGVEPVVLSEPNDEQISAATFRGATALAAEFDLPLREVLADEQAQNQTRAVAERLLSLRSGYKRRAYRASLVAAHGELDRAVAYLSDRSAFPLPRRIGSWVGGADSLGSVYYWRPGEPFGPIVWATPGWDEEPQLHIQIDLDPATGIEFEREIFVPWTLDPECDSALYVATVRAMIREAGLDVEVA